MKEIERLTPEQFKEQRPEAAKVLDAITSSDSHIAYCHDCDGLRVIIDGKCPSCHQPLKPARP